MWWPFRRKPGRAGVRGAPLTVTSGGGARTLARHEAVVERLGIALAKERHGRQRPERIAAYEAELRRHLELLATLRKG